MYMYTAFNRLLNDWVTWKNMILKQTTVHHLYK